MSKSILLIESRDDLSEAIANARRAEKSIGLVPTMGALHEGHLSLVGASSRECDWTVATIFVNPTQFGPEEDLDRYPRNLEEDLKKLAARGADLVFAPSAESMYPPGYQTYVEPGDVAATMEGVCRPGHFRGVATIVLKLFHLIPANVAYFGRKDYQQTLVIQKMVDDLDLPIHIRVCPIVREADGLAMSSRNAFLNKTERRQSREIYQSLTLAEGLVADGETAAETVRQRVVEYLESVGGIDLEYVALVREGTVKPVERIDGPTTICLAARVGQTRLVDNHLIRKAL